MALEEGRSHESCLESLRSVIGVAIRCSRRFLDSSGYRASTVAEGRGSKLRCAS